MNWDEVTLKVLDKEFGDSISFRNPSMCVFNKVVNRTYLAVIDKEFYPMVESTTITISNSIQDHIHQNVKLSLKSLFVDVCLSSVPSHELG